MPGVREGRPAARAVLLSVLVVVAASSWSPSAEGGRTVAATADGYYTRVASPDGHNSVAFILADGKPLYAVDRDGEVVVAESRLGLRFLAQPALDGSFSVTACQQTDHDETWRPVWGTDAEIRNHYRELTVSLVEDEPPHRKLELVFRAYDDGIAFRYRLPEQAALDSFLIVSELTRFCFPANHRTWSIPANFDSYEFLYRELFLDELDAANTPITLATAGGLYLSLHEADLTDYAGMTLAAIRDQPWTLECDLVPWPDGAKVRGRTPLRTPWRTIQIADRPGGLVESHLIQNCNEPCRLADTSWIQPAKYLGIWWGMHIRKETWHQGDSHGATTENTKRHIDFAAAHGIPALLIEGWNLGWEKWGSAGAFDFTTPYDDFDLPAVADYARQRSVAIIGHHESGGDVPGYEAQMADAFALYERLGITRVKTGYAGGIHPRGQHHHGQWMVNHYRRVVECAARHRVMLDVHEPIKPTGISRTWPNMMTREGVRGMEYNAWSEGNPPEHTTIVPFTRMLAGPLDYTPGIFDLTFDRYRPNNRVYTTLAKQLALFVVLYSPLQMAADLPENYDGHPAFSFVEVVPVDWDESRVLEGAIGDYVGIARRSGRSWFVGWVTDEEARTVTMPLDFLDADTRYLATIYRDAPDAHWQTDPQAYEIVERDFRHGDRYEASLAAGGGQALWIRPE